MIAVYLSFVVSVPYIARSFYLFWNHRRHFVIQRRFFEVSCGIAVSCFVACVLALIETALSANNLYETLESQRILVYSTIGIAHFATCLVFHRTYLMCLKGKVSSNRQNFCSHASNAMRRHDILWMSMCMYAYREKQNCWPMKSTHTTK